MDSHFLRIKNGMNAFIAKEDLFKQKWVLKISCVVMSSMTFHAAVVFGLAIKVVEFSAINMLCVVT